jgi:signal transduction histidine kinase/CheY-like chemotaxis protein
MSERSHEIPDAVFSEQVRLLYRAAPEAYVATILNAMLLSYMQEPVISPTRAWNWFLYMSLIILIRSVLVYRYWHTEATAVSPRTWNRLYAIGAGLSAAGWGLAGVLLDRPESFPHEVFLIFVLGGMAGGAVVALTPRIEVFLIFLLPTLLPVIVHSLLQQDVMRRMIGVMVLIYMLALIVAAWRMYGTIQSSLTLRHDNVALLQQLRSLSSALNRAQHRERTRLATSLHDNLAQTLALCKMKVHTLERKIGVEPWATLLAEITTYLEDSLTYTRSVMSELRPPVFGDAGDLGTAIAWVVEKLRRHGLIVTVEDDGESKPLDEEALTVLYQAVHELLYNVLKHANTNQAAVSLRRSGHTVQVSVTDRGSGLPPARATRPTSDAGFGLLNIRERVGQIGGQVHIHSMPGRGTSVTLTVPLKADLKEPAMQRETKATSGTWGMPPAPRDATETIRVMLVDDHEMIREGLRTIINGQDDLHVVAEASAGDIAVTRARNSRPDVILMDINLPTLNGVEATRRIKAELPAVAIIGLSVHEDERMALAMREAGASGYVSKGGSFEALCNTIRETVFKQRGV